MALQIQKATRRATKLKMAFVGPPGSGKTYTALAVAHALGPKILVADSERGSARKYAGQNGPDFFEFDVAELQSFSPKTYIEAIEAAEQGGYDVVILDSLSHAWAGKDGALEMVDNAKKRNNGNGFAGWRDVTPLHNKMVDAIIGARCHVIATMRAKTEFVQDKDERTGKTVVKKLGLQPVQREGMEYEFDIVCDIDAENNLLVGKTRCSAISGGLFPKAGADFGKVILDWVNDGEPAPVVRDPKLISEENIGKLREIASRYYEGDPEKGLAMYLKDNWGGKPIDMLTTQEGGAIFRMFHDELKKRKPATPPQSPNEGDSAPIANTQEPAPSDEPCLSEATRRAILALAGRLWSRDNRESELRAYLDAHFEGRPLEELAQSEGSAITAALQKAIRPDEATSSTTPKAAPAPASAGGKKGKATLLAKLWAEATAQGLDVTDSGRDRRLDETNIWLAGRKEAPIGSWSELKPFQVDLLANDLREGKFGWE